MHSCTRARQLWQADSSCSRAVRRDVSSRPSSNAASSLSVTHVTGGYNSVVDGLQLDESAVARACDDPRAVELWRRGRMARPELRSDPERFGIWMRTVLADPGNEGVASLHADQLVLAAACIEGNAIAIAILEREHLAVVAEVLRRARYDAALVDETIQVLRYRLLVATPERAPQLLGYRGRGTLTGWLRVTALRQARALLGPRVQAASEHDVAAAQESFQAAIVARDHGHAVRRLLRDAIAALDARAREALRLEVVEGLPHHAIADHLGVHRTTVVRWVEDARNTLAVAVRRGLRKELEIGAATADSVLQSLAIAQISIASVLRD